MMLPYTRCYLFYKISRNEISKFGRNLLLAKFGSERFNRKCTIQKQVRYLFSSLRKQPIFRDATAVSPRSNV